MDDHTNKEQSIELLQKLGLKEYEAKCFVALSRLPQGTAKEISEISEVPRTRVYDAVRVLESKGLVEIQHSNPQRFRAVAVGEAAETLRTEYEDRTERLQETLKDVDPASTEDDSDDNFEVWTLSGTSGIDSKAEQLIEECEEEVLLVVGDERTLNERLCECLRTAREPDRTVTVGTTSETIHSRATDLLPEEMVFSSELDWLCEGHSTEDGTDVGRILMVDRESILLSTIHEETSTDCEPEQAVIGHGFNNGFVTVIRRMLSTGLSSTHVSN